MSPTVLKSLFVALAHNHRKQATEGGGASGKEQWSLGVEEVLADAGRGDMRELFPRQRFATRSKLFWARNARLIKVLLLALISSHRGESSPPSLMAASAADLLLKGVATAKASSAHEDKRSYDCAAAEVGAGIASAAVAATREGRNAEARELGRVALDFFKTELEIVGLEGSLDWSDAVRFILCDSSGGSSEGSGGWDGEGLVSHIEERTKTVMEGGGDKRNDFSVQVKWLSLVGPALVELSASPDTAARAEDMARELCPLLVQGMGHPFKLAG
ncbi:unnamed protein product, partial [Choristocarpus tenellus]